MSYPHHFVQLDANTLLFLATVASGQRQLWRTDGTEAGTFALNVIPGPANFCVMPNGVCLFSAGDEVAGLELWRTDGTIAGTWRIADLNQYSSSGVENWNNY